jgi:hypothetical protein
MKSTPAWVSTYSWRSRCPGSRYGRFVSNPASTSSANRAEVAALVMPTRRAKSSKRVVP